MCSGVGKGGMGRRNVGARALWKVCGKLIMICLSAGSFDATVKLWDLKSQSHKPLMTLSEAKDSISSICVWGHEIFAGCVDGRVRTYDIRMGQVFVDLIGREYKDERGLSR